MQDIIQLFERQVGFVRQQDSAERVLRALPRLVAFTEREPRIAAICSDLHMELEAVLANVRALQVEEEARMSALQSAGTVAEVKAILGGYQYSKKEDQDV